METFQSEAGLEDHDDMPKAQPLNELLIDEHVDRLKAAGTSEALFVAALVLVRADKRLTGKEIFAIAWTYGRGGLRPKSRKAAIDKIELRFNEVVRNAANLKIAKAAKPW